MRSASIRALKLARLSFIRPVFSICSLLSSSTSPLGVSTTCALMGKGGFYAVRNGNGGFNGVLTSWSDAEIYIKGAKGCQQKKFPTRAEAEAFVKGGANAAAGVKNEIAKSKSKLPSAASSATSSSNAKSKTKDIAIPKIKGEVLTVYTDGACTNNGQWGARAGYGVFFGSNDPNNISEPLMGKIQTNQRAEMTAVVYAMRTAFKEKLVSSDMSLRIYTDSSVRFLVHTRARYR